jgi:hypothetical protein
MEEKFVITNLLDILQARGQHEAIYQARLINRRWYKVILDNCKVYLRTKGVFHVLWIYWTEKMMKELSNLVLSCNFHKHFRILTLEGVNSYLPCEANGVDIHENIVEDLCDSIVEYMRKYISRPWSKDRLKNMRLVAEILAYDLGEAKSLGKITGRNLYHLAIIGLKNKQFSYCRDIATRNTSSGEKEKE